MLGSGVNATLSGVTRTATVSWLCICSLQLDFEFPPSAVEQPASRERNDSHVCTTPVVRVLFSAAR
jgi:hypothetical protein